MLTGSTVSYSIFLWIATGLFLLRIDVEGYRAAQLKKEKKAARFTGWFNLVTGLGFTVWQWIS